MFSINTLEYMHVLHYLVRASALRKTVSLNTLKRFASRTLRAECFSPIFQPSAFCYRFNFRALSIYVNMDASTK